MRAIQRNRTFSAALSKNAALQAIYFLAGILVSRGAAFESFAPFGAAYSAAVPYENAFAAAFGSSIGYIMLLRGESFRCVASVVTIFALRWLFNDITKVSSSRLFAPLIAAAPLLCTGVVMILAMGKGRSALVMCLLEAMLAGVGAYFLRETALLAAGRRGIATFDQQEIACIVMSCCIFLLCANSLTIGGISVGRVLAVTAVMFCAYYGSVAGGCIGGTAAGVVFGLGTKDHSFVALGYSFGGLMAGLFSYVGRIGSAAAFVLCSAVASLKDGVTAQTAASFYETVIASVIFLAVPKEAGGRIALFVTPRTRSGENDDLRRGVIARLDLASKAIAGINDAVNSVAVKLGDYYSNEIGGVFRRSIEDNCTRCGMRAFCDRDGAEKNVERLSALEPILKSASAVDASDVRRIFNKKCCKGGEMADSVNENYESYKSFIAAKARAAQIRGVVAGQFSGLSEILDGLKTEFEKYESSDDATAEKICAMLKAKGVFPLECSVRLDTCGRMTAELILPSDSRRLLKRADLTDEVSRLCSRRMRPPETTQIGAKLRVTFCESPLLDVQVGTAQHICGDGRLCGDSFNYFTDGQGRFITVISDGMGTGGRAAVDGSMAVSVISKLVRSGLGFDAALSAANSALMVKSDDESLATADILSLDLFSGDAEIMKAGAPVTFFRKSGKIVRVEPLSLPAGILTDVKLTHDELSLSDGDLIIMVSDGAIAVSDEWIGAMMRDFEGDDIQQLVNDIIDEAMIGSHFTRDDDITVVGVRVMDR